MPPLGLCAVGGQNPRVALYFLIEICVETWSARGVIGGATGCRRGGATGCRRSSCVMGCATGCRPSSCSNCGTGGASGCRPSAGSNCRPYNTGGAYPRTPLGESASGLPL